MNLPENTAFPNDLRNTMLCVAAGFAACLAVWPVADFPFNDDWCYAFSVKRLAETGHLTYNGWETASCIAQAYWGLIWVKLFGFSFNVLRCSTILLAGSSSGLTYLLARKASLPASPAIFSAMLLALSPLFLPLATSFMTDVPATFCLLLSLTALIESMSSARRMPALFWLITGVIAAALGGSTRQIVWVVPFALLPCASWLRRSDRLFTTIACTMWICVLIGAICLQKWYESQWYSVPLPSLRLEWQRTLRDPATVITRCISVLLTLILITLPAGITLFRKSRQLLAISTLVFVMFGRFLLADRQFAVGPWMINILSKQGVLSGGLIDGPRSNLLPSPVFPVLSFLTFVVAALLIGGLIVSAMQPRQAWLTLTNALMKPTEGQVTIIALLVVGSLSLALLSTRAALEFSLFDRYLISIIPCTAIPLMQLGLRTPGGLYKRVPTFAWVMLGMYALYAIGSTQDELSLARARFDATRQLLKAGIPRTSINAGFEYNAWTQAEITGYINDPQIKFPPDAYQPGKGRTPAVKPIYRIEYGPVHGTRSSKFGTISYFTVWPPFERQIYIDEITRPN